MEVILSLVILRSAVPWSAIPLTVILELILSGCRVVKRSILSKILVEVSLWSIVPIIISVIIISVRAVIPSEWGRSIIISLVGWGSISSVLVSRRAVISVVPMYVVLLLWFRM